MLDTSVNNIMSGNVRKSRESSKPKNRQTKVHLIFDEKARKEYLTGFRKRKAERRKKFTEKLKKEIKSERKRLQTELRAKIKKSPSNKSIPGLEHFIENETEVHDLPDHTVTVETIFDSKQDSDTMFLGRNKANEESEPSSEEDSKATTELGFADKKKMKDINREMNKKLQKTKAFKRQNQIVRDKSRKKAQQKRRRK